MFSSQSLSSDASALSAPPSRRVVTLIAITAAGVAAAGFYGLARYVLANGHLHEDAYILFIFAEQLSETGRIAFYTGGPPAEGATDFLWMLVISLLSGLGVPSGQAALLLNSLGVALLGGLIAAGVLREGGGRFAAISFAMIVPLFSFVQSGYGGFSAPLYSALALSIFITLWRHVGAGLVAVPVLSILIGLFRPDGVIMGAGFTLAGLIVCPPALRVRFGAILGLVIVVGLAYFTWRWSYFGEFLPLPLLVKSASNEWFPGLGTNRKWAISHIVPLAGALIYLVAFVPNKGRLCAAAAPIFIMVATLSLAVQSQNVAFRFQAPATALLFYLTICGVAAALGKTRSALASRAIVVCFTVALVALNGPSLRKEIRYLTNEDYINFFPIHLASHVPNHTKIAMTEAGRLPYWIPGEKFDLVGLNTAYTARHGADPSFLAEVDPDIIFIHVARTILLNCESGPFCQLSPEYLAKTVEDGNLPASSDVDNRVRRAAIAVFEFLVQRPDEFDLVAVEYGRDRYNHLYAVARNGSVPLDVFLDSLGKSFSPAHRLSYLEGVQAQTD